jgi:hypothetical protein
MDKENKKVYFGNNKDFWVFDLNNDSLELNVSVKTVKNYIQSMMVDGKFYYADYQTLYVENIFTHKIVDSINISKDFNYHLFDEFIKFSDIQKIYFTLADWDGDERTDEKYFIYDEVIKKVFSYDKNDIFKQLIESPSSMIKCYDFSRKYIFWDEYILDSNCNLFNKIKEFNIYIYGLVIAKGEIKQLIIKSNLNLKEGEAEKTQVLIPFIPNPFREKALYEIYENIELKAEDLKQFDAFDLRILRNMIFAKHNYAFTNKFLQAYFNLYSFYGYKDNRLTSVSKLLTPQDGKNLELIRQAEEKMKNSKKK